MSGKFKGFTNSNEDSEIKLSIRNSEIDKIIKEYKKLKKYQKSSMFEIAKLSGRKTKVDNLIDQYGIDVEALE